MDVATAAALLQTFAGLPERVPADFVGRELGCFTVMRHGDDYFVTDGVLVTSVSSALTVIAVLKSQFLVRGVGQC